MTPDPAAGPASQARRLDPAEPRWLVGSPPEAERIRSLAGTLRLPPTLCAVLVARGFGEASAAKRHLRPLLDHLHDPLELADAARAVERLERAVDAGETVLVHGDYDVDGVAAAALYTRWLRRLGGRAVPFVPHRLRDGYDFGAAGLDAARGAGASLILTADCGTVAHPWLRRAAEAGLDVVVTDHHTPGDVLPPAVAFVNPAREDCPYPGEGLSGTGVAFKLVTLLARRAGIPFEELIPDLDLVALATVADLVPLRGENRVLVRYGLRALQATRKPGLRALLRVTGIGDGPVDAGRVAFGLAPRLNAVGRLGDAADALRLLLTEDATEAEALARRLDEHNHDRREADRKTLDEALALLVDGYDPDRDYGILLAREGWHPGVIGIVASRVVERIHRPVILVALEGEKGRGSARSIPGFHLYDALKACASHMERFGGHRQAAGMDVRRDRVDGLRAAFNREARERLDAELLRPALKIDVELPAASLAELDLRACEMLRYLGPHGIGNPRPVFLTRGVAVSEAPRVVGRGHLKLRLGRGAAGLEAIGFNLAERLGATVGPGSVVDAVFQLSVNEYRGRRTPQARLLDLRPSPAGAVGAPGSGGRAGGTELRGERGVPRA